MNEYLIEGSPPASAVVMGEYLEAETRQEALKAWKDRHEGWMAEKVTAVSPGHNYLGQVRPGCRCACGCHRTFLPGLRTGCPDCCVDPGDSRP